LGLILFEQSTFFEAGLISDPGQPMGDFKLHLCRYTKPEINVFTIFPIDVFRVKGKVRKHTMHYLKIKNTKLHTVLYCYNGNYSKSFGTQGQNLSEGN
jgi:hypothetical protein